MADVRTRTTAVGTEAPNARGELCLRVDELVAMVDGELPADRVDPVVAHIDRCERCAELVAKLGSLDGPARQVGRYRIERTLGSGGMGIVYAAFDPELQRRVAVKVVRPEHTNATLQALMLKEARTLARVSHPNVVTVYDAGEHDGEVFLATELVDGTTLAEWQTDRSPREIVDAWIQVARGLAAAHAEGVVHRDVKPSNVLVGRDGRVRIGDFGIAHGGGELLSGTPAATPAATSSDTVAGTPAYMAPEQRAGKVDARSDQFSACVSITEALTGARPEANATIVIEPAALAAVLQRGLQLDPDARYADMTEFAQELAAAIAPPSRRRRRSVAIAGVAMGVATLAGVIVFAVRSQPASCDVESIPEASWSPARRDRLAKLLPADGTPVIERWLARWSTAAADACASHAPGRERCLANQLSELDTLVTRWEATAPPTALAMHEALDALPRAAWCSAAAVAAGGDPLRARLFEQLLERASAEAAVDRVAAVKTLRTTIDVAPRDFSTVTAKLALLSVLGPDATPEAEALATSTRTQIAALGGDTAADAELDFRVGGFYGRAGRTAESVAAFERAHQGYRLAYGTDSVQEAHTLVSLAGGYFGRDGLTSRQGRAAGRAADAMWKRNGVAMPSVVPAETPAELIEQVHTLAKISLARFGTQSEAAFDVEYAYMEAYTIAEQPADALVHAEKARVLGARLGLKSVRIAIVLERTADRLVDLGRANEAVPIAHEAVEEARQIGDESELAAALTILGTALIATGDLAAAREPLERSLEIRDRINELARFRGNTRFLLATTLWTSDPKRARQLAVVARSEIESFLKTADSDHTANPLAAKFLGHVTQVRLDKIDKWLREHTRR